MEVERLRREIESLVATEECAKALNLCRIALREKNKRKIEMAADLFGYEKYEEVG